MLSFDPKLLGLVIAVAIAAATVIWMLQSCWEKQERRNTVIGSSLSSRLPPTEDGQ